MTTSQAWLDLSGGAPSRGESLDLKFARWAKENPRVLRDLVDIGRDLLASGEERLSIKMIFEVARFRFIIRRQPGERWALNNSYSSRAARLLEANWPEFKGRFETRVLADERTS